MAEIDFSDDGLVKAGILKNTDSGGILVGAGSPVRYAAGVLYRERKRLARIFSEAGQLDVAAKILDTSEDAEILKFIGPGKAK